MNYHDTVYGPERITEPVLLDLIESGAVQRLRGVLQHGISGLIGITARITRFEHSMGAMLLVRRLGGSLDEQIAALLHDISHTAFSHVIDYVFGGHDSQSYHEEQKEAYMAGTALPALLARHGYDWTEFLDETKFLLLEQPAPRLCADRLDYFLRDIRPLGLAEEAQIQSALRHLVVLDDRIAADDLNIARWLGYTFIEADEASWANFREVGLYELTAQAIRLALEQGIISESDFWLTDETVWAKLWADTDPKLQALLKLITLRTQFVWDESAPTFWVSTKLRAIDPDVVIAGEMQPLSSLDPEFKEHRTAYLERKRGKWPMRVVPAA
jgi:HD superfamily phosphohydrolase